MEAIILPVFPGNHWPLGGINIASKQFEAYDSLSKPVRNEYVFDASFPLPPIVCSSALTSA
jgi:Ulp1 family protease